MRLTPNVVLVRLQQTELLIFINNKTFALESGDFSPSWNSNLSPIINFCVLQSIREESDSLWTQITGFCMAQRNITVLIKGGAICQLRGWFPHL